VPYRLPDLLKYPDGTVFVCEGEKDADRVASLGYCATTAASGKWTEDCVAALRGRDILILEDNDDTGRRKAIEAAKALCGTVKRHMAIIGVCGVSRGSFATALAVILMRVAGRTCGGSRSDEFARLLLVRQESDTAEG
jgi:hypothetical protein